MNPALTLRALHRHLRRRLPAMVDLLGALVLLESPTHDHAAVTRLARFLARQWRPRGARVRLLRSRQSGALLRAELRLGRGRPQGQLLVLGHLDTVYARGTLRRMPFRVRRGRAGGPGTVDMKSGLVQALFAVEALEALRLAARQEGLILDPVYTSKAMAGLIDMIRQGRWGAGEHVVFLHTGGLPALWAYGGIIGDSRAA